MIWNIANKQCLGFGALNLRTCLGTSNRQHLGFGALNLRTYLGTSNCQHLGFGALNLRTYLGTSNCQHLARGPRRPKEKSPLSAFFFRNVANIFSFQTLIACSSGASSCLSIDLVFLELLKQRRLIFAKQSVEDSAEIESDFSKFGPRM
jgi:hypothetical protein